MKRFFSMLEWLEERDYFCSTRLDQWQAVRHLRNLASHPDDQTLIAPASAIRSLDLAAELTNELFEGSDDNTSSP